MSVTFMGSKITPEEICSKPFEYSHSGIRPIESTLSSYSNQPQRQLKLEGTNRISTSGKFMSRLSSAGKNAELQTIAHIRYI